MPLGGPAEAEDGEDPGRAISRLWPSLKALAALFGLLGGLAGGVLGAWGWLESHGIRPAWLYELREQGLYVSREILKDRLKHEGKLSPADLAKYCALSARLDIKTDGCED